MFAVAIVALGVHEEEPTTLNRSASRSTCVAKDFSRLDKEGLGSVDEEAGVLIHVGFVVR